MAISRQSDSIWAESAMGYGHSHNPARDEDHHKVGQGAHAHGESMGRKHADEVHHYDHRDAKGRFAPMSHHETEKEHEGDKFERREHRDAFHEGYHTGFHGRVREHERNDKAKANKHSFVIEAATSVDQIDPGRLHYMLGNGMSDEGYEEPSWLTKMQEQSPKGDKWEARNPTEKNPHRYDTDTLKNIANDPNLGLGLGMSEKAPFSPQDVGASGGRKSELTKRAPLRPGELASNPIQVTDHLGNVHTFVHHVTAPSLNPNNPDDPSAGGKWVVSLHHHINRPDGTAEWLPSEVTHHVPGMSAVRGKASDDVLRDIWGQLHANSDMVTMYGAGAQRVGDKDKTIEYEFRHPAGDVHYRAKLANGYNKKHGFYYDPLLPENHREALPGGPQWNVTGHALMRQYPHDPNSPTYMGLADGSDIPDSRNSVTFKKEDLPGVIQHVWNGLGVSQDNPAWRQYPQHHLPNTGGLPSEDLIRRKSALIPWVPEFNIHRSQERLPLWHGDDGYVVFQD